MAFHSEILSFHSAMIYSHGLLSFLDGISKFILTVLFRFSMETIKTRIEIHLLV
jgi:hypothetical protein